jgi:sulfotransferase family protein
MNHILIVSLSRSGGKLLRMLFDGHPALNVFPFEHWNRPSKNKIPTRRMEIFSRLSDDAKLETAGAAHVERKLARLHPQALVTDVMQAWLAKAAAAESLPAMYHRLAYAYFPLVGKTGEAVVVNHCGSLCRFTREQIGAVFGEGTYLLTIRDPRAVFSSMQGLLNRKFTADQGEDGDVSTSALQRHLEKLQTIDGVSGYLREFCEDYRGMVAGYAACTDVIRIRFEDLVTSPESTMRRLASQLAVRWDPTLLEPTQLGTAHRPNSSFRRQHAAIDDRAAADWVERLDPFVCRYIEEALAPEMAALGYVRAGQGSRLVLDSAPLLGAG